MKKYNTGRTIVHIELGGKLLKIGSASIGVWEEFEALSPENNPEKIAKGSMINFAKVIREAVKLTIKRLNKNVDIDEIHNDLSDLTEKDLLELWGAITDIDKHLITSTSYEDLTPEEIEELKKKKSL